MNQIIGKRAISLYFREDMPCKAKVARPFSSEYVFSEHNFDKP